jgi:hypothetical protein
MSETSTLIGYNGRLIGREELELVPTPPATETHRPIPHDKVKPDGGRRGETAHLTAIAKPADS